MPAVAFTVGSIKGLEAFVYDSIDLDSTTKQRKDESKPATVSTDIHRKSHAISTTIASTFNSNYTSFVNSNPKYAAFFLVKLINAKFECAPLTEWNSFFGPTDEPMIGFADPCSLDSNPGWPLRNFLFLIQYHFKVITIKVLCYRDSAPAMPSSSLVLTVTMKPLSSF